jgi:P-type E1-E2 ATPase
VGVWVGAGLLLFVVVIFTCYETFSQEAKSDQLMEKFRAMVPSSASVVRSGAVCTVPTEQLVIGDIVNIKSGDKVPADCRLIFNQGLKIDQVTLLFLS